MVGHPIVGNAIVSNLGPPVHSAIGRSALGKIAGIVFFILSSSFHIFAAEPPSPAIYGVRMENAWIPMKHGVRPAAPLYMPAGATPEEKFPALRKYLPYRKDDGTAA